MAPMRSALLALGATLLLAGCYGEHPKFRSTDITGVEWGKSLDLTGHDGKPRSLADFRGKVIVLAFGFTHCPDICPTTLSSIARAFKALGRPDRVQVLFITPDPERDTLPVLAKYVPAFDADFLGLRGGLDDTRKVASEFKIFFAKSRGSTPGAYSVDHSAQSFVLDARGRLRLLVTHERLQEDLTHDLRELLRERA